MILFCSSCFKCLQDRVTILSVPITRAQCHCPRCGQTECPRAASHENNCENVVDMTATQTIVATYEIPANMYGPNEAIPLEPRFLVGGPLDPADEWRYE